MLSTLFCYVYDTYGVKVSLHMLLSYSLTAISQVDDMYANKEEMVPKIAIFDHNTIKITS